MLPLNQILTLARAGNPARAWALFHSSGWDARTDDPKALTLKARLLKDQAKAASGAERVRLYGEAAEVYVQAAALDAKSYPLINAASLALLGGKEKQSRELAQEVLDLLAAHPDDAETEYWFDATRAEAWLLLGKETEARAAMREAVAKVPQAWEDHAATIGQFSLIIAEQGGNAAWLDRHRPPTSLHFSGIIGLDAGDSKIVREIDAAISREAPGFGYGALAAGADIMIAEALHEAGTELHITLPYPVERFREVSVAPFGATWLPRFDALIEAAATVNALTEMQTADERPLKAAIDLADQVAMGQAIRNAEILQSSAKALTITGAGETPRQQSAKWQLAGRELMVIEAKREDRGQAGSLKHDSAQDLSSLLWIENAGSDLPDNFMESNRGYYRVSSDLTENYMLALKILASEESNMSASLILDIFDESNPSPSLLEYAQYLARASDKGNLLTDHKTAMALQLADTGSNIEEIGELRATFGAVSIWSIFQTISPK